jgi:hypothetical protein
MRSGESLVPTSEDRLSVIFAEGRPDWLEEPSLTGVSGRDVIAAVIYYYRQRHASITSCRELDLLLMVKSRVVSLETPQPEVEVVD